jgi:hypothetical protein
LVALRDIRKHQSSFFKIVESLLLRLKKEQQEIQKKNKQQQALQEALKQKPDINTNAVRIWVFEKVDAFSRQTFSKLHIAFPFTGSGYAVKGSAAHLCDLFCAVPELV